MIQTGLVKTERIHRHDMFLKGSKTVVFRNGVRPRHVRTWARSCGTVLSSTAHTALFRGSPGSDTLSIRPDETADSQRTQ